MTAITNPSRQDTEAARDLRPTDEQMLAILETRPTEVLAETLDHLTGAALDRLHRIAGRILSERRPMAPQPSPGVPSAPVGRCPHCGTGSLRVDAGAIVCSRCGHKEAT